MLDMDSYIISPSEQRARAIDIRRRLMAPKRGSRPVAAEPEPEPVEPAPNPEQEPFRPEILGPVMPIEAPTWTEGVWCIADWHGLTLADIQSPGRSVPLVNARQDVAVYLRRRGWSYPRIGRFLRRDHTTIINLIQRSER